MLDISRPLAEVDPELDAMINFALSAPRDWHEIFDFPPDAEFVQQMKDMVNGKV